MLPMKIITYPSRREHLEHLEENVVGAGNYEQLLSEKVSQWPWFVDMVTTSGWQEDADISYNIGVEGKKTLVTRVLCKISKANPTYFNQAKGNPLKNKTFEPAALDIDLASCFDQPTPAIVVHFIQTATLTFVMIGWFCVKPSPSFATDVEQSNLMETPHRTITVHFVHLSANSRRQSLGSHFGGGAQISPAHLSTAWKRAVTYTPFTLIEDRFFAGAKSKKRKESPAATAATVPSPPVTTLAGRPPGPHEMILQELIKSMQTISDSKTTPTTPADWESWLDLPTLITNHWHKATEHAIGNIYSAIHGTMSGDNADPSDFTKQFHICIAFALFLYPYQMWSSFRLYTLSYALLPSKLRSMALEFDATRFNERSIGASSWIGLVTTIMAERIVLPTIQHSLKRLIVFLEAAPTDGDSARFIQLYRDIQSFTKEQYSAAFLDLYGMPPIDTQASATMPSNSSVITRQQGLNCEAFAKYIEVHIAHRSLAAPTPIAKSSNERPLLNECLIPLVAYFPYVILNKPIEDNYGRSKRVQTNFSITTIAKRTAAAATAATNKGDGDDDDTADVSITPTSNLIIDIEDMGVLTAPACLRRVIRIYEDDSVPFVHADRQHLLSSLFAAFAYFTGSTDTGKKWGRVPNPNHRQRIINLTMEWFKVHSPWRYAHIQARRDYGKDIAGYINLFAGKDEGSTFEQACACDPKRDQQLGVTKTSAKTTTRAIGASSRSSVQCPHLTAKGIKLEYTGEERKQALIACKKDMGYTEETMNLNYAPHPFDVWINQTVRVARRKVTAPNTSRQNNRPM